MVRQFSLITLVIPFITLAASGVLMLNSFGFQPQMHLEHKVFGVIIVFVDCLKQADGSYKC